MTCFVAMALDYHDVDVMSSSATVGYDVDVMSDPLAKALTTKETHQHDDLEETKPNL